MDYSSGSNTITILTIILSVSLLIIILGLLTRNIFVKKKLKSYPGKKTDLVDNKKGFTLLNQESDNEFDKHFENFHLSHFKTISLDDDNNEDIF